MERVSLPADLRARLQAYGEQVKAREQAQQAAHDEAMAALPPGTCERCYGQRTVTSGGATYACPQCVAVVVSAQGVPHEFVSSSFDSYRIEDGNRTAIAKARAFLSGDRDLYLAGGVGAGKTRLACAIANEWVRARKGGARFLRVPRMLYEMQGHDEHARALEQQLESTPLVVLDDVGAERDQASDFTRRTLLMLYEARHDRGLRTVWTSNKRLGELSEMQQDDRLTSRIGGWADVVTVQMPDQRLRRVK